MLLSATRRAVAVLARPLHRAGGRAISDNAEEEEKNPLHPWSGSVLPPLRVRTIGYGIIQNPLYNKGTAFSYPERDRLGLRGLLPPRRISMPLQMKQAMERMKALPTDIDRYEFLVNMCVCVCVCVHVCAYVCVCACGMCVVCVCDLVHAQFEHAHIYTDTVNSCETALISESHRLMSGAREDRNAHTHTLYTCAHMHTYIHTVDKLTH